MAPKIITEHVRQLVDEGRGDWIAYYEDGEELVAGFGRTKEEAVVDLTAKFPVEEE